MRYIKLNEDTQPATAVTPRLDGNIRDEVCLTVMAALKTLSKTSLDASRRHARRRAPKSSKYHAGRSAAYWQAVQMLEGILSGEFAIKRLTEVEIIDATALD